MNSCTPHETPHTHTSHTHTPHTRTQVIHYLSNVVSRTFEFQADAFAVKTGEGHGGGVRWRVAARRGE